MAGMNEIETGPGGDERKGSVTVRFAGRRARLHLAGEVDSSMNPELAPVAVELAQRGLPVDVDTRAVTFMDSTVIALVAHLANQLPARVSFIDPPEHVRFLLQITQVEDLVEIIEAVDDEPGRVDDEPLEPSGALS